MANEAFGNTIIDITDNKTATVTNSLTLSGNDGTTITFQGTDTYVGRSTTDTLTNKTYDTAGVGNVLKINGTQVTNVTGTGKVVLDTAPILPTTLTVGATGGATGILNIKGITSGSITLTTQAAAGSYTLTLPNTAGTINQMLTTDGSGGLSWTNAPGGGNVTGPGSSTDTAIVRWNGTGGTVIQNSGVLISAANAITGALSTDVSSVYKFKTKQFLKGISSGSHGATEYDITILGDSAGPSPGGSQNTLIGYSTANGGALGNNNTLVGSFTGDLLGSSGSPADNTLIGADIGELMTSGTGNTIVGSRAAISNLTTGSNNLLLGTAADVDTGARSNAIVLNSFGAQFSATADKEMFIKYANKITVVNSASILSVLDFSAITATTKTFTIPNVSGTLITSGNLSAITATGTIASGIWNGTVISTVFGGTGTNNSAATNGAIPYYSAGSVQTFLASTATASKVLLSGANTAPTWSTSTYPTSAGTVNNVLVSNGTNWTSATVPVPTLKNGTTTKDVSTTTTTTIAHGLGKAPTVVRITSTGANATGSAFMYSSGIFITGSQNCVYFGHSSNTNFSGTDTVALHLALINANSATERGVKGTVSVDATNITITWATLAGGSGVGTANLLWEVT